MITIISQISIDTPVNFWFLMLAVGSITALIIIGKLFTDALEEIKGLERENKSLKKLLGRDE